MNRWIGRVPAVLQAWFPGQEGGTALAEILFGDVNPSGHLPATFERRWQENPVHDSYYPAPGTDRVGYTEGVFVGYRGYEHKRIQPRYAFGHGLSYTTLKYRNLKIRMSEGASAAEAASQLHCDVSFEVTNTGRRVGAAVPQIYVGDAHARVPRPPKELKGFTKLVLQPGETRAVSVRLDARAFAYYDVNAGRWRADAGEFAILVGSSSAQIEIEGQAPLTRDIEIAP